MKIAVASDHRGVAMKSRIIDRLREMNYEVTDFGPDSEDSVDYPDYAAPVASAVSRGEYDRGILICGTGMGMCIAANKYQGVRATPCHDEVTTELSRRHNDANVLCMSAELLGENLVDRMIDLWTQVEFEGGRHARRLGKVADIEQHPDQAESLNSVSE